MSDRRVRELERLAAQGDATAAGKLLLERVRVGDLPEKRLRLAAVLGDHAATEALGGASEEPASLGELSRKLRRQELAIRAALAATEAALPAWENVHGVETGMELVPKAVSWTLVNSVKPGDFADLSLRAGTVRRLMIEIALEAREILKEVPRGQ